MGFLLYILVMAWIELTESEKNMKLWAYCARDFNDFVNRFVSPFPFLFLRLYLEIIKQIQIRIVVFYFLLFIVVIFYKFTFVEFLVRQKIACHERIHLKFTKRTQL